MKKKVLVTLGSLLALLAVLAVGGHAWLKSWVTRSKLIAQMEAGWNCRADLASTSLSLVRSPALVEIRRLRLVPPDDEVAKPLASRAAINPTQVLLSAETIDLAVT